MFIREIWGKFKKSELGKFIQNFPVKYVITGTNFAKFLRTLVLFYRAPPDDCLCIISTLDMLFFVLQCNIVWQTQRCWRKYIHLKESSMDWNKFSIKSGFLVIIQFRFSILQYENIYRAVIIRLHWKLWVWSHLLKKSLMENFIFWAVYLARCDFLSVSILLLPVWWQIKHYSINFCNNTKRLLYELVLNIYKLFKPSFRLYVFMGYRKRSVVWNGFIMEVTKICQKLTALLALESLENKERK